MAKIMVVDDAPADLQNLKNILTKGGHQVIEVTSGQDSIAKAKAEKPDAIVMDVVMPGVNGFQATRQISKIRHRHHRTARQAASRNRRRHDLTHFGVLAQHRAVERSPDARVVEIRLRNILRRPRRAHARFGRAHLRLGRCCRRARVLQRHQRAQ
jgi:twitching motility two-component system response regulator PilH